MRRFLMWALFAAAVAAIIITACELAAGAAELGDSCATSACVFSTQCADQPNIYGYIDCYVAMDCSAQCGPTMTCTTDQVCAGPVCGRGDVACDAGWLCDYARDCVHACYGPDGQPMTDVPPAGMTCAAEGEVALQDGTCVIPSNYRLCAALGGHPGP